MIKAGIVKGDGNSLNPLGKATRAEAAVMIYRLYSLYFSALN
jgi:beta-glucosidase